VFYHLSSPSLAGRVKQPTLRIERAALQLRFIWSFNSQGLPETTVTSYFRELLPHIFTITLPQAERLYFSVALAVPAVMRDLPVRKWDALCCPDFPLPIINRRAAIERPAITKVMKKTRAPPDLPKGEESEHISQTESID